MDKLLNQKPFCLGLDRLCLFRVSVFCSFISEYLSTTAYQIYRCVYPTAISIEITFIISLVSATWHLIFITFHTVLQII